MRVLLILLLGLTLLGCEVFDLNEEPVDVSCRAECADCESVVLECNGTGRATITQKKTLNK